MYAYGLWPQSKTYISVLAIPWGPWGSAVPQNPLPYSGGSPSNPPAWGWGWHPQTPREIENGILAEGQLNIHRVAFDPGRGEVVYMFTCKLLEPEINKRDVKIVSN